MKLGYPTITWGGVVGTAGGVTSVKDLFYRTNGSTEQALRDIAAAGYTGTEMFDGNLVEYEEDPETLLGWLHETNLELVGVYTGANFIYADILDEELHKITRAATLAARFGATRLVIGGGAKRVGAPHDGDFDALARGLDRAAAIAAAHGLESSYHPHLGTLVETPEGLERLMALSTIQFCPDTAHLAAGGGRPGRTDPPVCKPSGPCSPQGLRPRHPALHAARAGSPRLSRHHCSSAGVRLRELADGRAR